jgi:hypothetical protein
MRRTRSLCCARVTSGQTAGAPPELQENPAVSMPPPKSKERASYRVKAGDWKRSQCPLWVKCRHVQCKRPCPLCPRKRTCAAQNGMSAKCQ